MSEVSTGLFQSRRAIPNQSGGSINRYHCRDAASRIWCDERKARMSLKSKGQVDLYAPTYGRFSETLHSEVRRDTWGEEFGQSGWTTAAEQDRFIELLGLGSDHTLLDVGCGSGGPTLRIVERTGVTAYGVDMHHDGIATARKQAQDRQLTHRVTFDACDARDPLPFSDDSFDAVISIDAISHMPRRAQVLTQWARVIRPGGKLLFTNASVLTDEASHEELAIRGGFGLQIYTAPEVDDRAIASAGLTLLFKEDTTEQTATIAERWHAARAQRESGLRDAEGDEAFERLQGFLAVASQLARERRLRRYMYVAQKQ
jgi:cyclopropane fatty-acyl-phospholipid synthase-like methyltransferase